MQKHTTAETLSSNRMYDRSHEDMPSTSLQGAIKVEKEMDSGDCIDPDWTEYSASQIPRGKRKKNRQFNCCFFPECNLRMRSIKNHVQKFHLPECFREVDLLPGSEAQCLVSRKLCLEWLSERLTGSARIEGLIRIANKSGLVRLKTMVHPRQDRLMRAMCKAQKWPIPKKFTLNPVRSPAALIHWRVLVALLLHLPLEERRQFKVLTAQTVMRARSVANSTITNNPGVKNQRDKSGGVLDAGCRLDLCRLKLFGRRSMADVDDIVHKLGEFPLRLPQKGGLAIMADLSMPVGPLNHGWKVALGIEPKDGVLLDERGWEEINSSIQQNYVVAFGTLGLDFRLAKELMGIQEDVLRRALQAPIKGKTIILSIQGKAGGNSYLEHERLLKIVKNECERRQRIIFHDFQGDVETLRSWAEAFVYCYFSFSGAVVNFDERQRAALRAIPQDRLLVCSNAPGSQGADLASLTSPAYVGVVTNAVAFAKGMSEIKCGEICNRNLEKALGVDWKL